MITTTDNGRTTEAVMICVDWVEGFRAWLVNRGSAEKTVQAYVQDVHAFGRWFVQANGQALTPDAITGVDLRQFRAWHVTSKAAPSTWNRRRATMKLLCDYGLTIGALSYNPFQGVEPLAEVDLPPRWLDETEVHKLLRQVELLVNGSRTEAGMRQARRDAAMVALMLYAGLREAEVCDLDVSDIVLTERKGKVVVRSGKGGKKREVPLGAEARRALRVYLDEGRGTALGTTPDEGEEALFVGKGGERATPKVVQGRVKALRVGAGLDEDVTPHALRHTFAKRLVDAGQPLHLVAKLMGHSRITTTARYAQPGWGDFEKAVE